MNKKEQPIKFIYLTKVDKETITFLTKRFNVVKECSGYVSLEDGIRIKMSDIKDVYVNTCEYTPGGIIFSLLHGYSVYTIKPISKTIKDAIKEDLIDQFKNELEVDKKRLTDAKSELEALENRIAEEEAKLSKLLKL